MPLLPAVVPDIPENRAEVAPARLARKIAPLFGVPWPDGPFGGRTWVCDYAKITLSEIARGAPLPTREQAARIRQPDEGAWTVVDRIGVTGTHAALPNEIANATLNRFGPDTRAAVVLTAVNRLLEPVRAGIDSALALVVDDRGAPLPEPLRLAAWASLVIEVFRSQPALVAAGVHARAIQRELVQPWQLPLAAGLDDLPLTRCEVAPRSAARPPGSAPAALDVADRTFAALHVDPRSAEFPDLDPDLDSGPAELAGRLRQGESVELLLRRLLAAGTGAEASYLWMSERKPGQLAVEALLPPSAVIDRFVRDALRLLGVPGTMTDAPTTLPVVPSVERLAELSLHGRRAAFIALLAILRHVQNSPSARDATRGKIVPVLAAVADRARAVLDADDPVAAVVACRVADMTVQTLRPDRRQDLRGPLEDLLTALARCEELLDRGVLDRGAAAETISSACVELNAVAQTNARITDGALPDPAALRERVRHGWGAYHEALEIRPFSTAIDEPRVSGLAGYHLHNYAAFLAGSTEEADLREAVALFRDVVIPAREEFFAGSGHFLPLRNALQVASRATTRLGEALRARGDVAAAGEAARLGHRWITAALGAEETRRLLAAEPPTESASRFALLAAPALLLAAELGGSDAGTDLRRVEALIHLVRRWERTTVGESAHHTRHDEVEALSDRLTAVRQRPGAG